MGKEEDSRSQVYAGPLYLYVISLHLYRDGPDEVKKKTAEAKCMLDLCIYM